MPAPRPVNSLREQMGNVDNHGCFEERFYLPRARVGTVLLADIMNAPRPKRMALTRAARNLPCKSMI